MKTAAGGRIRAGTLPGILGAVLALAALGAVAGPREDAQAALAAGNDAAALKLLGPLAEQGDAAAQFDLGVMFNKGRGVRQSPDLAAQWFLKSAEQGYAPAQHALAGQYEDGRGVPQDYAQSLKWYRRAAEQGHGESGFMLGVKYADGIGVPKDSVQAHRWFSVAAAGGSANAASARDRIAAKLTPAQLAESKKLALESQPKKPAVP